MVFPSVPFSARHRYGTVHSGWILLSAMALFLIVLGVAAIAVASSVVMLSHEIALTGFDAHFLQTHHHDHTLRSYLVHNRVSFGGVLVAIGVLYLWLVRGPLRQDARWAWWTLVVSAGAGATSYVSYVANGYYDLLHAAGTAVIVLALVFGAKAAWREGYAAQLRFTGFRQFLAGRMTGVHILLTIWGAGTLVGGAIILTIGMFPVFVVEDYHYLGATAEVLNAIDPQLIAFLAHDRTGFGGALVALGLVVLGIVWLADNSQLAAAFRWLAFSWAVGVVTAIGIHPLVGYNSLSHLAPFILKDGAFVLALLLWTKKGAGHG